jgi:hypothetical protein
MQDGNRNQPEVRVNLKSDTFYTLLSQARIPGFALILTAGLNWYARADMTWVYAVQLSTTIQTNPPQITLHWPQDELGANNYVVQRKLKAETSWGLATTLPGSATNFTDTTVSVGSAYEYQVTKHAALGYTGYGYIYTGIYAPMIENRGTLILIVAADPVYLAQELTRLESDLTGDGWLVIRHDVSPDDSPASVRQLILNDYVADPNNVQAVFLFGHVPVLMSGNINYDSHGAKAMPADGFYGDMTGDWGVDRDPTSRPSYFPTPINLMVGRVDFFDMLGLQGASPWPSEKDLLRQYLNKDHTWRHKRVVVPRRAIMANRVGDAGGLAYAASGYRNFEPFVGPGNIIEADISDAAPPEHRWVSMVTSNAWLWSYGCGGGQDNVVSQLGTHNIYHDLWSSDIVAQDAKVVFSMFFGSHFGDWTRTDNLLRSALATPTLGLAACIVGSPHWFCHHMALGEPIGYAARLTMNNSGLYQNQVNGLARTVFINLLADPTLRMESVAPPSGLSATSLKGGVVSLKWSSSTDTVLGYHVYRSASSNGPFSRLTTSPIIETAFTDSTPFQTTTPVYMVRAVALQTNPSGSYFNPSEGIFVTTTVDTSPQPLATTVSAAFKPQGIELNWNTQTNLIYHVEAKFPFAENAWTNISGPLNAASSLLFFVDTNAVLYRTRLYRIVSE